VGLDIGHRLARVAVVEHKQGMKGTLLALEQETIPEGIVVDNEIRNVSVLIDRVQTLLTRASPGGIDGDFLISVNWTSGILCDKMLVKPVPKVPERELILQTAQGRPPFDDAGNILDYSILEYKEEGIEAMIVAAKKDSLTAWINLFQALNIKLCAIDVDAFVLSNIYSASRADISGLSSGGEAEMDESVLLLNFGHGKSYAALLRNGHFSTARSILGGSVSDLQEQLSGPLGILPEQSGELLMGTGARDSELDDSKIKFATEFVFEEVAMKVDTALRYFSSADNYKKPTKMVLTGGGSNIIGLEAFLADRLSVQSVQLNPFKNVELDKSRFLGVDWNTAASTYSVALGLALRRF
jgi:type IV pilus assembly protein PilM